MFRLPNLIDDPASSHLSKKMTSGSQSSIEIAAHRLPLKSPSLKNAVYKELYGNPV